MGRGAAACGATRHERYAGRTADQRRAAWASSGSSAGTGTGLVAKKARGKAKNVIVRLGKDFRRKLGQIGAIPSSATSGAGAAVSITLAADPLIRYILRALNVSYSAAPTGGRISVTDGGTTVLDMDITAAGPLSIYLGEGGIQGIGKNRAMVATLAAPGGAVIGKVSLAYEPG